MSISSSNETCLEPKKVITYNAQKDLFNNILLAPIGDHLTLALNGFEVKSQILNLTLGPLFYHNSCISSLNDQSKGTLNMYILRPFQWYFEGLIWCLFVFSTKAINI
jgi:hypothetical protein